MEFFGMDCPGVFIIVAESRLLLVLFTSVHNCQKGTSCLKRNNVFLCLL